VKKIKLFLSVFLLFTTLLSCESIVYAAKGLDELQQEMEERSEKIKEKEKQIKEKQAEKDAEVEKRIELDMQITGLSTDIVEIENVISEKETEIENKTTQIDTLQSLIDENHDLLKNRIRATYEYGNLSYLEVLLEADGFGDLLTRISLLKDIVEHDKNIINSYISNQTEIADAKQVVITERNEQVEAKGLLETKQNELEVLQEEKQKTIDALTSDIEAYEKEVQAEEAEYQAIMEEVKKAQEEMKRQEEKKKAEAEKKPSTSSDSKSNTNTSTQPSGGGGFAWPSDSHRITSHFGMREKPNANATSNHRGIDIGAAHGTNVYAMDSGTVIVAGSGRSYGNYVVISHANGYTSLYAHNSVLCVSVGDKVSKGQVIAKVGSTGNSTGPHIHFEVSQNGVLKDPMSLY